MTDYHVSPAEIPWVPLREGLSMRPLRFEDEGYSLHLKLEPGTVIGRHRHTGPVRALNLRGARQIIASGEVVGPGDFIFEPVGNEDSWRCHGDEPCVIHICLTGRVEYLGEEGSVTSYSDSDTARRAYLDHCAAIGVEPDRRILGA